MNALLDRILEGGDLSEDEADALVVELTREDLSPMLSSAVLAGLRAKGESADEVRGLARALRRLARRPAISDVVPLLDVVGTGGDGSGSLNISTGTALLAAAMGHRVVKHGNRSVSSRSGSADVLEALGLPVPLDEIGAARCLERTGFTFLFAPHYHPAMKALAQVRRTLGVRTVFNILGPLVNPMMPAFNLIGAYSPKVARLMADALAGMPIERAFVVHGEHGWDEATTAGVFLLFDVRPGIVREERREPGDYGLPRCRPADLLGGDAGENARRLREALRGAPGAYLDTLVLGGALVEELTGRNGSRPRAVDAARGAVEDGRAAGLLDRIAGMGAELSRG